MAAAGAAELQELELVDLQKSPSALTGAFELKVTGRQPTQFGDAVTPVVDVYDQYLATSELQLNTLTLAAGLASFNTVTTTVPNGKAWRFKGASMLGALNVADAALVTIQIIGLQSPNSAPQTCRIADRQYAATPNPRVCSYIGPPIFLPSGWKIVFELWSSAALTVATNLVCSVFLQEINV